MRVRPRRGLPGIGRVLIFLLLCLFCVFILAPLSWMLATTLRLPLESFRIPPSLLPTSFNLDSYRMVFQKVDFFAFIQNSVKVSLCCTVLHVLCSSMAAYAFARLRFPGKRFLFVAFLSALMIPSQVMNIPRFIMMAKLKLVDTHLALILPSLFGAMGIFLIRQFMMTIPKSYDEAAYIDGATKFYCYLRIIMPMTKPALIVIALQTFISTWNDFYNPLIYLNTTSKMTLPLGLTALQSTLDTGNQSAILAGIILSLVAPLLFFLFGQRYLVEGINLGGVK